jgi:hypothetical protein
MEEAWLFTSTLWAKLAKRMVTVMSCTELTTTATSARASAKPGASTIT